MSCRGCSPPSSSRRSRLAHRCVSREDAEDGTSIGRPRESAVLRYLASFRGSVALVGRRPLTRGVDRARGKALPEGVDSSGTAARLRDWVIPDLQCASSSARSYRVLLRSDFATRSARIQTPICKRCSRGAAAGVIGIVQNVEAVLDATGRRARTRLPECTAFLSF